MKFHAGVSYRNLLIVEDAAGTEPTCQPPHDIPDKPVADYPPRGTGADRVVEIMDRAREMLQDHEVNRIRREQGRDPVTDIWLWGQGRPAKLVPFRDRFGVGGAVITGVDIIRGLAVCMGMDLIEVEGATGYIDTNYAGKGEAAVAALDDYDMVVVHVEAADEAGHMGDALEKVRALERIDTHIVGPLVSAAKRYGDHRILIAADHPTPVTTRAHSAVPPLFCYAGTGIEAVEKLPFHDRAAEESGLFLSTGHTMIDRFMKKG